MPFRLFLALLVAMLALPGCSYFQFPGVHRVEIQQGNIITREMVDQLQTGMSRGQVRYILGTPMIADTFNQDQWDYYHSIKKANGKVVRKNITVFFEGDYLTHFTSDNLPTEISSSK